MTRKKSASSFENALEEFEKLVETLEDGDLSLEESLKTYERGMQLSRTCHGALDAAERRIEILTEQAGEERRVPFEPDVTD